MQIATSEPCPCAVRSEHEHFVNIIPRSCKEFKWTGVGQVRILHADPGQEGRYWRKGTILFPSNICLYKLLDVFILCHLFIVCDKYCYQTDVALKSDWKKKKNKKKPNVCDRGWGQVAETRRWSVASLLVYTRLAPVELILNQHKNNSNFTNILSSGIALWFSWVSGR